LWHEQASDMQVNMLIFYCADCKEKIKCPDNDDPDQVFGRLDEHIAKCPLAQFTFEGTSNIARLRADDIRAAIASNTVATRLLLH